jgi:hypothetical protein
VWEGYVVYWGNPLKRALKSRFWLSFTLALVLCFNFKMTEKIEEIGNVFTDK